MHLMFYFFGHERCRKDAQHFVRGPVNVPGSFAPYIGGPDTAASHLSHAEVLAARFAVKAV